MSLNFSTVLENFGKYCLSLMHLFSVGLLWTPKAWQPLP